MQPFSMMQLMTQGLLLGPLHYVLSRPEPQEKSKVAKEKQVHTSLMQLSSPGRLLGPVHCVQSRPEPPEKEEAVKEEQAHNSLEVQQVSQVFKSFTAAGVHGSAKEQYD